MKKNEPNNSDRVGAWLDESIAAFRSANRPYEPGIYERESDGSAYYYKDGELMCAPLSADPDAPRFFEEEAIVVADFDEPLSAEAMIEIHEGVIPVFLKEDARIAAKAAGWRIAIFYVENDKHEHPGEAGYGYGPEAGVKYLFHPALGRVIAFINPDGSMEVANERA